MTSEKMRIASPCSENLDAMRKTERGAYCEACQHEVVDLRRAQKKRALSVLRELRARAAAEGSSRVCVRVMARGDGAPVFLNDPPSPLARLAAPMVLAASLAACAPTTSAGPTTPLALVQDHESRSQPNVNGRVPPAPIVTATLPPGTQTQPGVVSYEMPADVAGGMVFFEGP